MTKRRWDAFSSLLLPRRGAALPLNSNAMGVCYANIPDPPALMHYQTRRGASMNGRERDQRASRPKNERERVATTAALDVSISVCRIPSTLLPFVLPVEWNYR